MDAAGADDWVSVSTIAVTLLAIILLAVILRGPRKAPARAGQKTLLTDLLLTDLGDDVLRLCLTRLDISSLLKARAAHSKICTAAEGVPSTANWLASNLTLAELVRARAPAAAIQQRLATHLNEGILACDGWSDPYGRRRTPLHQAVAERAPLYIIKELIDGCPSACSTRSDPPLVDPVESRQHPTLPIHDAAGMLWPEALALLLDAAPGTAQVHAGREGYLPLHRVCWPYNRDPPEFADEWRGLAAPWERSVRLLVAAYPGAATTASLATREWPLSIANDMNAPEAVRQALRDAPTPVDAFGNPVGGPQARMLRAVKTPAVDVRRITKKRRETARLQYLASEHVFRSAPQTGRVRVDQVSGNMVLTTSERVGSGWSRLSSELEEQIENEDAVASAWYEMR